MLLFYVSTKVQYGCRARAGAISIRCRRFVPWYAMVPEGERGTFRIDAMPSSSRELTAQSDYDTFILLTESNKQASQHWIGNQARPPSLGSAYAAPVIRTRKRWVSNSIVPLHVTDITIEPTSIIVYEGEPVKRICHCSNERWFNNS
ncbi:hypothetical protein [Vibrio parahaemolyticus]|uniref:hypothetical protein n=1 Tax=Vibrio parahaemolyticus TaxID=670 RepID=UPI001C58D4BA|nr:hypothetical protein [Vibrio parahaemolyticus]